MRRAVLLAALLGALLLAPLARADGDPASDYLITYQVFYPYYSNTPKKELSALEATVADANKRGYPIRVAVITSPYDLGSLSALWGKPQPYARFLATELSFVYQSRLLIVSPAGFGYVDGVKVTNGQPKVVVSPATLAKLRSVPIGKGTTGLLVSADKAVRKLAASAGQPLPLEKGSSGSGGSGMDTLWIAVIGVAALLLIVGIEIWRRRRRLSASAEGGVGG
jgi:hypothetical protein